MVTIESKRPVMITWENGYAQISVQSRADADIEYWTTWPKNEKFRFVIESWHKNENTMIVMKLAGIRTKKAIDTRIIGLHPLRPMDVDYRGLTISSIKTDRLMLYPCWDVSAYCMFGSADQYVTINRNNLIPNKIIEVYDKIANCADEALRFFWEYLHDIWLREKDKFYIELKREFEDGDLCLDEETWSNQWNALALSVLYQQVQCRNMYKENRAYLDDIAPEIIKMCDLRISAVGRYGGRNGIFDLEEIDNGVMINKVFENGVCSACFINKQQFSGTKCYIENQSRNSPMPSVFVLDIFSEYLRSRGMIADTKNIFGFKKEKFKSADENMLLQLTHINNIYIFAYMFPQATEGIWHPDAEFENDWMHSLAKITCSYMKHEKNKVHNGKRDTNFTAINNDNKGKIGLEEKWDSLVIMPAFNSYEKIHLTKLPPDTCPNELWNLGVLAVMPVTYADLRRFAEKIEDMHAITKPCLAKKDGKHKHSNAIVKITDLPAADNEQHPLNMRINTLAKEYLHQTESAIDIELVKMNYRHCLVDFLCTLYSIISKKICPNEQKKPTPMHAESMKDILHGCFLDHY